MATSSDTPAPAPQWGLRPLGVYGEGYCRVCRFIEPLTDKGLIARHDRGSITGNPAQECKGSYSKPPKVTPYASRLSAFKSTAKQEHCSACQSDIPVLADGRFGSHRNKLTYQLCAGSLYPPQWVQDRFGRKPGSAA